MAWRLHLMNQTIRRLDLLGGKEPVLVVWTRPERAYYYDLPTGVLLAEQTLPETPRETSGPEWQPLLESLKTPDQKQPLPVVEGRGWLLYSSQNGKMRLLRLSETELFFETGDERSRLPVRAERLPALAFDALDGRCAALDAEGNLHLYEKHVYAGSFKIGLQAHSDWIPSVAIGKGGRVAASDGRHLVTVDGAGKVLRTIETYYHIVRLAASPKGERLMTSDGEAGVLRVYKASDLSLTHQRFAIDLVAEATQVQLLADLPPLDTGISSLTLDDSGNIAFVMAGVVCASDLSYMDEVPRPQRTR